MIQLEDELVKRDPGFQDFRGEGSRSGKSARLPAQPPGRMLDPKGPSEGGRTGREEGNVTVEFFAGHGAATSTCASGGTASASGAGGPGAEGGKGHSTEAGQWPTAPGHTPRTCHGPQRRFSVRSVFGEGLLRGRAAVRYHGPVQGRAGGGGRGWGSQASWHCGDTVVMERNTRDPIQRWVIGLSSL